MITHPAPHAGLGVAQYAWSTSPLRRYVDLVNQWQIAACLEGGGAPAFAQNDADLFGIVSGFDAAYAAYADYQSKMERYWCLRWLGQEGRTLVEARATGREDNAMLVDIPLLVRVPGMAAQWTTSDTSSGMTGVVRGQRIEIEILSTDLLDLTVQCRLVAIIEEVDELETDEDLGAAASEPAPGSAEAGVTVLDAETAAAESSAADSAASEPQHAST
jgi:exoribonuclease-2